MKLSFHLILLIAASLALRVDQVAFPMHAPRIFCYSVQLLRHKVITPETLNGTSESIGRSQGARLQPLNER
jgi:hypothetical protein